MTPRPTAPYEPVAERWQSVTQRFEKAIYHAMTLADRQRWILTPYLAELQVFSCGYFSRAWGHKWERKGLDEGILIYCTAGKGYYQEGGRSWTLRPGELLYCFPKTAHRYSADADDPWTHYWMHLRGPRTQVYCRHIGLSRTNPVVPIGMQPAVMTLFQNLFTKFGAIHDTTNMLAIQSCASDILGTIAVARQSKSILMPLPGAIHQIIRLMNESLDTQIDVAQLAATLQMSSSHFNRIFRKATGLSPIQYFHQLKMRQACMLLTDTPLKVKEIAGRLGFDDPYYFSRYFKRLTGHSPEYYRTLA